MKQSISIALLIFVGTWCFGQRLVTNDPTYSIHNYKHANKAAYARLHHLDLVSTFAVTPVNLNRNYKQPANQTTEAVAVLTARPMDRSTRSYKHPAGL